MVDEAIQEVFPGQNGQIRPVAPDLCGQTVMTTRRGSGILPSEKE
jgi:hypothetical protein